MRTLPGLVSLALVFFGLEPYALSVSTYTCAAVPINSSNPIVLEPTSITNQLQTAGTWLGPGTGFVVDAAGKAIPYTQPPGIVAVAAINNLGQVAGWTGDPHDPWPPGTPTVSFISNPDGSLVILNPPPNTPTQTFGNIRISGINDNGDVLGEISFTDQNGNHQPGTPDQYWFIRDAGGAYQIFDPHSGPGKETTPGRTLTFGPVGSINNLGIAVLDDRIRYADGSEKTIPLPDAFGYAWTWYGMNSAGYTVGNFTEGRYAIPFSALLGPDGHEPAVICPNVSGMLAFSINDAGVIAGSVPGNAQILLAMPTGFHSGVDLTNTNWGFSPNPAGVQGGSGTIYLTSNGAADLNIEAITIGARDSNDMPGDFRLETSGTTCGLLDIGSGQIAQQPKTFAPGEFCSITFTFTPQGVGARSAQLMVYDDAPDAPHIIRLNGTGTGKGSLVISNNSWNFGPPVPIGKSSGPGTIYIYNPGTDPVNISSIAFNGANASDFHILQNTCKATFSAYTTCAVTFQFTPTAAGARMANLLLSDDAPGAPQTIPMVGFGF